MDFQKFMLGHTGEMNKKGGSNDPFFMSNSTVLLQEIHHTV